MSVWASLWATVILACYQFSGWGHYVPWLNWPFALAWVYLWHLESVTTKRVESKGRMFSVELSKTGQFSVTRAELNKDEMLKIVELLYTPQQIQQPQDQSQAASGD